MGRNGGCNYAEWERFKENLEQLDTEIDSFVQSCAKELAARLLTKVIKRTPVGEYDKGTGKVGGTLRRGWTGGRTSGGSTYAQSLKVNQYGGVYHIELINPTEYASYVEYGHRTRGGKGWVKGKFMMTLSAEEIQRTAPAILEKKIQTKLKECFNDQ